MQGAFVTLATNDVYCKGAIVLAQSLRVYNTTNDIVVMITPQVSASLRQVLDKLFDKVVLVNLLDSNDIAKLALLKRPELGITFTKLHCWTLTEYEKCVFMDADTMVLANIDELFDYEEFSAAPDAGWPDIFNSGVFVFKPSIETYYDLIKLAETVGSFDGGDQGLLNTYFDTWLKGDPRKHLSFLYNMHSNATYTYSPAFARFGHDTKVVHFTGSVKPWHYMHDRVTDMLFHDQSPTLHEEKFIREWWKLNYLSEDVMNSSSEGEVAEEKVHQWKWKTAHIDYTGADKFDKLQQKISSTLQEPKKEELVASPQQSSLNSANPSPKKDALPVESDLQKIDSTSQFTEGDEKSSTENKERYENWKRGQVDFLGKDSFQSILSRINSSMQDQLKLDAQK